jgi:hypothetical protein
MLLAVTLLTKAWDDSTLISFIDEELKNALITERSDSNEANKKIPSFVVVSLFISTFSIVITELVSSSTESLEVMSKKVEFANADC